MCDLAVVLCEPQRWQEEELASMWLGGAFGAMQNAPSLPSSDGSYTSSILFDEN